MPHLKFVGRTRPGEIGTAPTGPIRVALPDPFIPVKGRQTGLSICTQAEIDRDLDLARTFKLPQTGFRCIEARRIFLRERGTELLGRAELSRREAIVRRREITDRSLAARAGDVLNEVFGGFKFPEFPEIAAEFRGTILALGVFAVVLLVVTRGS